jgi:hypothetical protein
MNDVPAAYGAAVHRTMAEGEALEAVRAKTGLLHGRVVTTVAPITKKMTRLSGDVYNYETNAFELVEILADSGSEANVAPRQYVGASTASQQPISLRGYGGSSEVEELGVLTLRTDAWGVLHIPTLKTVNGSTESGSRIILNADTINQLGLDGQPPVDSTLALDLLPTVSEAMDKATVTANFGALNDDGSIDWGNFGTIGTTMQQPALEGAVNIVDAVVKDVWEKQDGNPFPKQPFSIEDIVFAVDATPKQLREAKLSGRLWGQLEAGGTLSLEQTQKLQRLLQDKKAAFASKKFPRANNCEPVQVKILPPAERPPKAKVPVHVPQPTFTAYQRKYLWAYLSRGLDEGLIVPSDFSEWCTYIHLVKKKDQEGRVVALRPTENHRPINAVAEKLKYPMPIGAQELQRASTPARFGMTTDANAAFKWLPG